MLNCGPRKGLVEQGWIPVSKRDSSSQNASDPQHTQMEESKSSGSFAVADIQRLPPATVLVHAFAKIESTMTSFSGKEFHVKLCKKIEEDCGQDDKNWFDLG